MHDTLAKMSLSAYGDLEQVKKAHPDYQVDLIQNNGTQVYIFEDADFLVFAFRGTEPIEKSKGTYSGFFGWLKHLKDKFRDIITDLQFRKVPVAWGSIHRGFHQAIEIVWPKLWKLVQAHEGKHIFITGHSLGGSLACLFAMMLSRRDSKPVAVVTFGAPRVGNSTFRRLYNAILGKITYRYHFRNDPVPHLPMWVMGFRHVGKLQWWCGKKLKKRMGIWAWVWSVLKGDPAHHSMKNYVGIWPEENDTSVIAE